MMSCRKVEPTRVECGGPERGRDSTGSQGRDMMAEEGAEKGEEFVDTTVGCFNWYIVQGTQDRQLSSCLFVGTSLDNTQCNVCED